MVNGGFQAAGGLGEGCLALSLLANAGPLGLLGAVVFAYHGADNLATGVTNALYGDEAPTYTEQVAGPQVNEGLNQAAVLVGFFQLLASEGPSRSGGGRTGRSSSARGAPRAVGGVRTGQTGLEGPRDVRNLTTARLQGNASTCGLHSATSVITDVTPTRGPLDLSGVRGQIRGNANAGLSSIQIEGYLSRNLPEDVAVLLERGVTEPRLPEMLDRGHVLAHVDSNHWVRVLGTFEEGNATWAQIYDPARGIYEQLLSSFMTRTGPNNQMIWVRP